MTNLALIADIGGTNARFALTDPSAATPQILREQTLRDVEFASLREAARHYLDDTGAKPRRAALAVASPVHTDKITLTNRAWSFSRSALQQALGLDELRVINDFGAIARAAPHLQADARIILHGDADAPLRAPVTLIGPGTGLGVALLLGSQEQGWEAVETEGGHAGFAPTCDEEEKIAHWITARYGRASNERLLSGGGLSSIDAVLRGVASKSPDEAQSDLRAPKDIVDAALRGDDEIARRALARFCAVLGSVAGDAALIHGAHTVMIAGGMALHFLDFLHASAFRQRFIDKGRFVDYMNAMAIHVITHQNPGLLGAAVALRHLRARSTA